MSERIQILLVDDHALFRESVGRLLAQEPNIAVVGVCGSLREAEVTLRSLVVDIVLLDYDLGDELGTRLLKTLRDDFPKTKVALLTGGVSVAVISNCLQSGVKGLLLKHCSPELLLQAVQQIANGGTWWDPMAMAAVASAPPVASSLSERQTSILELLLKGLSNKEISAALNVSESSVKASLQELFRKTGVRTRSQLVRIAVEATIGENMSIERIKLSS